MSASTSTTSKVIGTFRPCTTTYEPCTLGESLESSHASSDTPRSFRLRNTIADERGCFGKGWLKFNALFSPEGSTDSFPAQLYLQFTVDGDLPHGHPPLNDAHLILETHHPDVLSWMIDTTKTSDKVNKRGDRFLDSELKVYDTRGTLTDQIGSEWVPAFAVDWKKVEYRAGSGEVNTSEGGRNIIIPTSNIMYRASMWLSIPGFDLETGTVRTDEGAEDLS